MKPSSICFCLLLLLSVFSVQAQKGNYFLSHHAPTEEEIDFLSFKIVQDQNGVIYFANKTGIVEFDGRNWKVVNAPGSIFTLTVSSDNELFGGGLTGFGKFTLDENNALAYISLSDEVKAENVFDSKQSGNHLYFLDESNIYDFNLEGQVVGNIIKAEEGQVFAGLLELPGGLFVADNNSAIFRLNGAKLEPARFEFLAGEDVLFSERPTGVETFLIGTTSGRLFTFDGKDGVEIQCQDREFLQNNVVIAGRWVNEDLIAIGTLSGGVIFINPKTGATEEVINYYTGLPDNEVFAMMTDRNQGVWVAHDYGFTRIAPFLPFRTYNHYPGLSGNLLSAYSDQEMVYVGTSVGLFTLVKEEVYTDETYYVTRLQKTQSSKKSEPQQVQQEDKTETKKSRKGLFSFLKRNKGKETEEEETQEQADQPGTTRKITVKKTRRVLQSLSYVYKKVEGISGKVTNLTKVNGKLLAAGIGGVFQIDSLTSKEVLTAPVRTLFFSPSLNQLLVSTYNDKVRTLVYEDDNWRETFSLDTINQYVGNIFEDHLKNIWLCGRAEVIKIETVDGAVTSTSSVPFSSPVLDETMGFVLGPDVFVAAAGSFHRYDVVADQLVKYDSLPGPRKYFTSLGTFWFNDGRRWRTVDLKLQNSLRLQWLGLFPDIRSLTMADDGNGLWLITGNNELYRFMKTDLDKIVNNYPLFLKEVRGPESKLSPRRTLIVDQEKSALSFEFIQPEYTNALAIEYQYMIDGINKDWSEWSASNNVVNFPFLNPGKYKLRIKSRDLFGQISELEAVDFRVVPPYWKQTWFYALEFIFFGSLVLLSLRLSTSNSRYRHLSQLLSILTVIMLIQLLQNTAESFIAVQTTPVVDFFIQVFIALLILPLEYWMRRIMIGASEGKYNLEKVKIDLKNKLT